MFIQVCYFRIIFSVFIYPLLPIKCDTHTLDTLFQAVEVTANILSSFSHIRFNHTPFLSVSVSILYLPCSLILCIYISCAVLFSLHSRAFVYLLRSCVSYYISIVMTFNVCISSQLEWMALVCVWVLLVSAVYYMLYPFYFVALIHCFINDAHESRSISVFLLLLFHFVVAYNFINKYHFSHFLSVTLYFYNG